MKSGEVHLSPGQNTADVLQLECLFWSWTRARWFHRVVGGGNFCPDHWLQSRESSAQKYCVITALAVYTAIDPNLPYCVRWLLTLWERLKTRPLTCLLFNPVRCLPTENLDGGNRFTRRWPDHVLGTHIESWYKYTIYGIHHLSESFPIDWVGLVDFTYRSLLC